MTNKQVIAMIISVILSVIIVELFKWYQNINKTKKKKRYLNTF